MQKRRQSPQWMRWGGKGQRPKKRKPYTATRIGFHHPPMSPSPDPPPPPTPPAAPGDEINDPPPPYPSRGRRSRRPNRRQIQTSLHGQIASTDSHSDHDAPLSPQIISAEDEGDEDATENTPFLPGRRAITRPRSESRPSVFSSVSVAPSLAQTIASLFRTYDDDEVFNTEGGDDGLLISTGELPEVHTRPPAFWSVRAWRRYFRPLTQKVYYRSLFHLYVLNFPFALAAFLFGVVFTVTGTTLLVALPLGALLCFFNLLGVRTFSRGELALQTKFHGPLAYPAPYPPRPIFSRTREVQRVGCPNPRDIVLQKHVRHGNFKDPTSYQALFYFLVIKPSITLLLSLGLLVVGVPAIVLVGPAPLAFRAIRNLGIWQANIAVEGLYLAVR
ncbi:hypothetical protein MVEN_00845100 [Mycena venus]|uniref:Sensor domain-containing protein n=1 Tax=Mycena venus TaxID=2733690 RepID=A0A8H6YGP9_9AGAR|nr:hypothetical protein MVEN_00845100 [Mycena venus]